MDEKNNMLITNNIKDNNWQVYYSERGNKIVLKEFESEHEACEYFYKKMKRYFKDRIIK